MKVAQALAFLSLVVLAAIHFADRTTIGLSRQTSDFDSIAVSLKTYKINAGHYPSTDQGLAALITRPDTQPVPKKWIQLLQKLPPDPWDREYRYRELPDHDKRGFEIISAGKDGVFGTNDDISSLDD